MMLFIIFFQFMSDLVNLHLLIVAIPFMSFASKDFEFIWLSNILTLNVLEKVIPETCLAHYSQ
jgi:hypothetical protein